MWTITITSFAAEGMAVNGQNPARKYRRHRKSHISSKKKLLFELKFIGDPQGRVKFEGLHFTSVSINARPYD